MAEAPHPGDGPGLPIASGAEVWGALRGHLRRERGRLAGVAVLFLVAAALGLVMPACLGRIVDAVTAGAAWPVVAVWVAGVAAGAIGAALVALWGARILVGLVQDLLARLREDVFTAAMRLPARRVDDAESADLLSRVTGDVDAVSEAGGNVVPALLSAGFAIVVSLAALTVLNPWLAFAGLACVPFYVLGTRAFLRRSRVVFREVRAREAARSQAVLEAIDGHETLTALNEQGHALDLVAERARASIRVQIVGVGLRNRLFRSINGGEAAGLIGILAAGWLLHAQGALTVGAVTTAALVFHRLFDPIGQLIFGLDDVQRAAIGLARLVGVIGLAADAPLPHPATPAAATARTAIELREVSFAYPGTARGVRGVSMRGAPGTTTAIVGASGSGKSTLARLIAGHDAPAAGTLRLTPPAIPFALSQELHLFRGGVAANLRLAAPGASDAELGAALTAAGADWAKPLVAAAPGSDLDLDPDLDGGRIQQLAVARAILADPALVILDEATADVGLQHRAEVDRAIAALRRGRTAVLIAHQLQHAATADQILVCADGAVIERGTHEELIAAGGAYRRFWLAQTGPRGVMPPHASPNDPPTTPPETETP
ncbi:ABC transporter ATP-binding protein [Leucobacter luti]|uniref:ABC transporter ATP-binding protein n=1 Tax=Leucobacter luti TaxID=340320 RepID=UPI00102B0CB3|nr:ABC transporter ATP-binding protein [Leucobacter luti]